MRKRESWKDENTGCDKKKDCTCKEIFNLLKNADNCKDCGESSIQASVKLQNALEGYLSCQSNMINHFMENNTCNETILEVNEQTHETVDCIRVITKHLCRMLEDGLYMCECFDDEC